jgi:hypothetical protein
MNSRTVALLIAAISIVLVAWLGRYEVFAVPAGGQGLHGIAYRLDRWTGNVIWMRRDESGIVKEEK